MSRGKWITGGGLLAVALAALWYFASPAYTLNAMQKAAQKGDGDAFAAYVDFPALREDLKAEMMARLLAESQKDKSGFGGLGLAFGSAMVGPMVDGIVSPSGIKAAFAVRRADGETGGKGAKRALAVPEKPVIKRRGLSEFLVASKDEPESGLVFRRSGLGWKLSGVDLPPERSPAGGR